MNKKRIILVAGLLVGFIAVVCYADLFSPNWGGGSATGVSKTAFKNISTVNADLVRITARDFNGTAKAIWVKKEAANQPVNALNGELTLKLNGKVSYLQFGTYSASGVTITLSK